MWKLSRTAKTTGTRPSRLLGIDDPWTALQLDNAVTLVGSVIEDASQELENVGSKKEPKWESKYTMDQLLDPDFRLPPPPDREDAERKAVETFKGLPGVRVVKGASGAKEKES